MLVLFRVDICLVAKCLHVFGLVQKAVFQILIASVSRINVEKSLFGIRVVCFEF